MQVRTCNRITFDLFCKRHQHDFHLFQLQTNHTTSPFQSARDCLKKCHRKKSLLRMQRKFTQVPHNAQMQYFEYKKTI